MHDVASLSGTGTGAEGHVHIVNDTASRGVKSTLQSPPTEQQHKHYTYQQVKSWLPALTRYDAWNAFFRYSDLGAQRFELAVREQRPWPQTDGGMDGDRNNVRNLPANELDSSLC